MAKLSFVHIFLTLTFLAVSVTVIGGSENRVCSILSTPNPRGTCGSRLADVAQAVCRAIVPETQRVKRNAESVDILSDITLSKPNALSYLTKRQHGGNIVCECCFNQCVITELYKYCF